MYSYQDRLQAVKLYIKLGKRTAATIRQLGYPTKNSLKIWYEDYRQDLDLPAGYDILKKANELIKKHLGIDRQRLTNREKTLLVDALRHVYALSELLKELGLARSSYFYHRARLQVADKYFEVRRTIADIFGRITAAMATAV